MRPFLKIMRSDRHKKKKKSLKLLLILIILIVIIGVVCFIGLKKYNSAIGPIDNENTEVIVVEIPKGSSGYKIISILDENGLCEQSIYTKVFLKLNKYDKLQANVYCLNKSMSLKEIFDIISNGTFEYIYKSYLTIIDGCTIPDAISSIAKALDINEDLIYEKWSDPDYLKTFIDKYEWLTDDILKSGIKYPLEGYIYPETYYITGELTIDNVTKTILAQTDKILSPRMEQIKESGFTCHELITLASMVQKEAYYKDDKAKVAGVFINRLNKPMRLQACCTVNYALGTSHLDITVTETKTKSPYNTYINDGLPIGPISNPNVESIDAVLNYDHNDYYFFFSCEDHTTIFTKTYEEHLKVIKANKWY